MRLFLILALMASPALAERTTHTLSVDGRARAWHLHAPPGGARGRPLVLALHGGGGTGAGFDRSTRGQMTREATRRRWTLVFPEGVDKGWNDGRPPLARRDRGRAGVDDVAFLERLIQQLVRVHGADPRRVYVTGISNGGFMSQRLALEKADQVAAIGVVASAMAEAWQDRRPSLPVPAIFIAGTEDPLVLYGGGMLRVLGQDRGRLLAVPATVARWAGYAGCDPAPSRIDRPDRARRDRTRVRSIRYSGCRAGAEVQLLRIDGGGHTWPQGRQYLPRVLIGRVSQEISGAATVFDFFARFRR